MKKIDLLHCFRGLAGLSAPVINTDAEELQWMEQEKLSGIVEGNGENKVRIRIDKGQIYKKLIYYPVFAFYEELG